MKTILLVDDSATILLSISNTLAEAAGASGGWNDHVTSQCGGVVQTAAHQLS
jgi:hypothetical protein